MEYRSGNQPIIQWLQNFTEYHMFPFGERGPYALLSALSLGIILPILLFSLVMEKKRRKRAKQIDFSLDSELIMRNKRFPALVKVPWEGANTMASLFEQSCRKYSGNKFLGTRKLINREIEIAGGGRKLEKLHLGEYEWMTYREAYDRACNFASGLVKLGHNPDSPVAIFSETRAEWFLALQGLFRQNITAVTIYASLGDEALIHSLNETEVSAVICDAKQLRKLSAIGSHLENIRHVIHFEDEGNLVDSYTLERIKKWTVLSFNDIEKLGRENPVNPSLPSSSNTAVIMYTSGSTGLPKGVMITHGNIVASAAAVTTIVPDLGTGDVYLAYLPLAHVFELAAETVMLSAGCAVGYGSAMTLTDTSNKIKKGTKGDASVLKPTAMAAVPAILDRVRDGVLKKVEKNALSKRLFHVAYRRRLAAIEGSWFGAWGLERLFWESLIFKRIQAILGGRLRYMLCGGAPLSGDTQRFINICLGTPIGQGYGLTETSGGGTFTESDDTTVGRVGPPLPCCYVKLVSWEEGGYKISDKPMPRGEVVIGGFSVTQGYFKNIEKSNEVYKVDEREIRWFYTGDIGKFHPDGCLEIIDRKKDIVKLQHGEYVSLGKVEAELKSSIYVEDIMIHADPFHS